MKLAGKSVMITGGTSGMGAATARLFAEEGADLTIASRSPWSDELRSDIAHHGNKAIFVATDISRSDDVRLLFARHMETFGKLDVLFNNAAYDGPGTSVRDTTDDELEKVLATNVKGVFTACREAIPHMAAAGGGVIINTTAASAREGLAWPNLGAYIASKGAVISLTRALAVELAGDHIRVNSLNPGVVETPLLDGFAAKSPDPAAFHESLKSVQLAGRVGRPEEIARAALFLASDDSSFVMGADLLVDGGLVLA
jgi:3-oxoacyl-[acyl-carrier protein] reductase